MEREQYLSHLLRQGTSRLRVRAISNYLVHFIRLTELTSLRSMASDEIEKVGERWASYQGPHRQKKAGKAAASCISTVARNWLRFHGQLIVDSTPTHPLEELAPEFAKAMSACGLAPDTIRSYSSRIMVFLQWLKPRQSSLATISMKDIDEFLATKRAAGWRSSTLASQCQALRSFFRHAEFQGWCSPGIAHGIKSPVIPKYEEVAKGPTWKEVRKLLQATQGTKAAALRARAILLLAAIYALRSSEIGGLRLSDFDWRNETFSVQRAKRGRVQHYPIQYEVGETILQYLQKGRPRCASRHVFVTLCPPYRPLRASSMWQITSRRMKRLGIESAHMGPHSLRHACATQLLKKGSSLAEIADFLGHRDCRSAGIYAKYDRRSLRKVAAFSLGGLR